MENEAITLELEQSSASRRASAHVERANGTSSLTYIPGTMQSMVDELIAEMLLIDDAFEQMNFIILKLMPAVLEEQEQSIAEIAPLIEANKDYNERLVAIQRDFAKWGTVNPTENKFFEKVDELGETLKNDPNYGVQEEMLDSVDRIMKNADDITKNPQNPLAETDLTSEQAAWNAANAPESAYNYDGKFESYPISSVSSSNFDKAITNTSQFQPFMDQTNQELEILKGLNVNMAKQMELDLKYKVEFYNSYVSSIGSMEDNTSKQRRAPIDRLRS